MEAQNGRVLQEGLIKRPPQGQAATFVEGLLGVSAPILLMLLQGKMLFQESGMPTESASQKSVYIKLECIFNLTSPQLLTKAEGNVTPAWIPFSVTAVNSGSSIGVPAIAAPLAPATLHEAHFSFPCERLMCLGPA